MTGGHGWPPARASGDAGLEGKEGPARGRLDQADDAQVDGDLPYTPGSARGALSHPDFRSVWFGTFASNIGTWMQNVALGVLAYQLTHSATYVAVIGLAQLGPLFLLSMVGGALADVVDRKKLLIGCQVQDLVFSVALAWVAAQSHPSTEGIFLCVLAVGIGNALSAPVLSAVLPVLVPKRDLPGAVSLQSVQLNLSRVIGPAIGGLLLPFVHVWGIFALNAGTYGFAILVIARVALPRRGTETTSGPSGLSRVLGGLAVARADPLVRYCLVTMAAISFFCLPFIGLMPVVAARDLHIDPAGALYGGLYALFGVGGGGRGRARRDGAPRRPQDVADPTGAGRSGPVTGLLRPHPGHLVGLRSGRRSRLLSTSSR
jgi:MFS family permease